MRIILITLFVFLVFPQLAFAQIEFEPGYYIDNSGDTTHCFIQNLDWRNNPSRIKVRPENSNSISVKTINDIREFVIHNDFKYRRFSVFINFATNNTFDSNPGPELQDMKVFLKVLLEGKATLYEFTYGNTTNYFYALEGQRPECLVFKEYVNENGVRRRSSTFRKQIWEKLRCQGISVNSVSHLKYNKSSLTNYFKLYNTCQGSVSIKLSSNNPASRFSLRPTYGVEFVTGWIGNDMDNEFLDVPLDKGIENVIGLNMEYILPFNKNKWSLTFQTNLHSYFTQGTENTRVKVKRRAIEFPLGFTHYFFIDNGKKLFINPNFVTSLQYNFKQELELSNRQLELDSGNNFMIKTGLDWNKIRIEFGYHFSRSIVNKYFFWDSRYRRIYLGLGYKII